MLLNYLNEIKSFRAIYINKVVVDPTGFININVCLLEIPQEQGEKQMCYNFHRADI